ncbi:transmembrane protein 97-like [Panicum miliaceum]|uniref:Transmembrane protein 97-like n=1 Tax=Panicum miliaceum TaxID=4540 RepID=A0A3L6T391_PANMI|nr:transmembrane protein 97-like [Panicum miliaceum]
MAAVSKADAAVALFSLVIAVAVPLLDSQVILPRHLYPAPLVSAFKGFVDEFDHYLLAAPPPFLHGFVWLALTFLCPVCVANLYGILARRRWVAAATTLMVGVTMLTYMSGMFGEMLGSGRATPKLVKFYSAVVVIAVALVVRGLCLCSDLEVPAAAVESSVQKKRV